MNICFFLAQVKDIISDCTKELLYITGKDLQGAGMTQILTI